MTTGSDDEVNASELTSTLSIGVPHDPEADATASDPERLVAESLDPGSALLVVRNGPGAGSRFLLDVAMVTAGRHHDSDIFLDDVTVSRRHAQFLRSDHGFRVKDVGSLNGTYVNRERIDEVQLSSGDIVQIGKYRLVYIESVGPATHPHEEAE